MLWAEKRISSDTQTKFAKKEVAAHSHSNLFFRLKYMLLKVEDQFDFVGMNCAMRPAKSAIF